MSPAKLLERLTGVRAIVASVALTHRDTCRCDICRAAAGDEAALGRVHDWLAAPGQGAGE